MERWLVVISDWLSMSVTLDVLIGILVERGVTEPATLIVAHDAVHQEKSSLACSWQPITVRNDPPVTGDHRRGSYAI